MLPRRVLGQLFAAGALLTLLVLPGGGAPVSDSPFRLGVAHWLLTGSPPLEGMQTTEPLVLRDRWGQPTPWYGIGQSLILIPGDAAAIALGADTPRERFLIAQYLTFPIVNGLAVAAAGAFLAAAGFGAFAAVAGALALPFCTTLLWHFQNNQENPLQLLLVLIALTCALRWQATADRRWLLIMGAALGFNLLIRLPNAIDAAAVSAVPLFGSRRRHYLREWLRCVLPFIAAGVAGDRLYHFARFGDWTSNYMQMYGDLGRRLGMPVPPDWPFSNPFWVGMTGPFVSLQKSVFLFDPMLVVAICAAFARKRFERPQARQILLLSLGGLLFTAAAYATFYNWGAESGWGDRFLTTWVWIGCALAVPILLEAQVSRRLVTALVAVVFALQLSSIVFPSWIEEVQLQMYDVVVPGKVTVPDERFDHFVIGQRLRNIGAKLTGSTALHDPMIVAAMPMRSLPLWGSTLIRLAWIGIAIALFVVARRLLSRREAR